MKIKDVNELFKQQLGSALNYKINLLITIIHIDENGEHTPVPFYNLEIKYSNVFHGIQQLVFGQVNGILNYISLNNEIEGRRLDDNQEKIIRTEILNCFEWNDINSSVESILKKYKKKLKIFQESLINNETFKFLSRNFKIDYEITISPLGGVVEVEKPVKSVKELSPAKKVELLELVELPEEKWIALPGKAYSGYSYPDILVSVNRSYLGKSWNECQKLLHNEGCFMLTIRQFVDFINLLKSEDAKYSDGVKLTKEEKEIILDEILKFRNPWRGEWLDAKFTKIKNGIYITYHKIKDDGELEEFSEELKDCLTSDKTPGIDLDYWLSNSTSWGIPKTNIPNGSLYYWHPIDTAVVRFCVDSGRVYLDCYRYPQYSISWLWVRRAKIFK